VLDFCPDDKMLAYYKGLNEAAKVLMSQILMSSPFVRELSIRSYNFGC